MCEYTKERKIGKIQMNQAPYSIQGMFKISLDIILGKQRTGQKIAGMN